MKTIIAGGRDQRLTEERLNILFDFLDDITEVVSGCASGIDSDAIDWAKQHNIPYKEFPADWDCYGKSAGPIRNEQMAKYADAVILFKGGGGTKNMFETAKRYNLEIFDFRRI